jgi:uncharacterized protein YjbI with pentapeptide repeats
MFHQLTCAYPGCGKRTICIYEGETPRQFGGFCADHLGVGEKNDAAEEIALHIRQSETITGLCADGLAFSGLDVSNKRFYGCSFRHCLFTGLRAENTRIRLCSFDFAAFEGCRFQKANIQVSSFGAATLENTRFEGSDLVHNSFCGIIARNSAFNGSDLYNSRFIAADISASTMEDCNLLHVDFTDMRFSGLSFLSSNTRKAHFSPGVTVEGV